MMDELTHKEDGMVLGNVPDTASSVEDMSIEEYLGSVTSYDVPDNSIKGILIRRGIRFGSQITSLTERDIDLATADVYMWCATTPSSKSSTEDSDGLWKHKEGGWATSAFDKRELRRMARELYSKWGEDLAKGSRFRIINF